MICVSKLRFDKYISSVTSIQLIAIKFRFARYLEKLANMTLKKISIIRSTYVKHNYIGLNKENGNKANEII